MSPPSCYVVLQYNGQQFAGWQRQKSDRTVQGELERVLERLVGRRVVTHGAGRTDAGVHALGQVVSFTLPRAWELPELLRALRALCPPDIWPARLGPAPSGFHARRDAVARRYRYVLGCDPAAASPFRRPFEWALAEPLDADLLERAARALVGTHDFRAFAAVGQRRAHHQCTVTLAEWTTRPDAEGFIFTIEADRFLHRMVRFLVGTMVDIARGRRPSDDLPRLLAATSNAETSVPAPPEGLYLIDVRYPELPEGYDR